MEVFDLKNSHSSFDKQLLADATALPSGVFIELDDLTFQLNNLGRKIARTLLVVIEGRAVSMVYIDGSGYELVLARDRPAVLGTYAALRLRHAEAHQHLLDACKGEPLGPQETVTALLAITTGGTKSASEAVAWARTHTRRCLWVLENRLEATSNAPVAWASIGL